VALELIAAGTLDGVALARAPVAGVVWHAGTLLRVDEGRVIWALPADPPDALAVDGRRLYLAFGASLGCVDLLTGALVWTQDLRAAARALAARPDGVDVVTEDGVLPFDRFGRPGDRFGEGLQIHAVRAVGAMRYVGGPAGVWRLAPDARPVLLTTQPCLSLHVRGGALQALTHGDAGTALLEDAGLPLVWSFPDAPAHWLEPWGDADWAVVPRGGPAGAWVVDRRLRPRWRVRMPGTTTGAAVAGRAVAVLLEDEGSVLALAHPAAPDPVLLAVDPHATLYGDGDCLYLSHPGRTDVLLVRED
jgi:hypothetical protein